MDFRKVFSERIATHLRYGMTLHTGIHTTFRRAGAITYPSKCGHILRSGGYIQRSWELYF
ncbi:MAG: hypothetical protein IPP86_11495 [Bacteroidetes bacterium]|nr:hypothetical protein [Bacteroidota bacterium]